jgi:hypothetical protein
LPTPRSEEEDIVSQEPSRTDGPQQRGRTWKEFAAAAIEKESKKRKEEEAKPVSWLYRIGHGVYRAITGAFIFGSMSFVMAFIWYAEDECITCAGALSWEAIWQAVRFYVTIGFVGGGIVGAAKGVDTVFERATNLIDDDDI